MELLKEVSDGLTLLFTFGLVVVGGLQVWVMRRQARIMTDQTAILRNSDATSRGALTISKQAFDVAVKAAEAAEKSANTAEVALTELERPFVYVRARYRTVTIQSTTGGSVQAPDRGVVEVIFSNFGRTPANLTRIYFAVSPAQHGSIAPPIDPRTIGGRELPTGVISDKDNPHIESENVRMMVIGDRQSMWIVGFVRYQDIFRTNHITGFAMVYDPIGDQFVTRGGQQYNYARMELPEGIPEPSARS